ncbi:hypothetical protein LCGC14_0393600 [marine sediment metagenome]|uniref:Uncharacterized protein n=1 Tax=marine sediment metagenome TaxID=412755 RepID=A0A0F9W7W0_9ZZZZ
MGVHNSFMPSEVLAERYEEVRCNTVSLILFIYKW